MSQKTRSTLTIDAVAQAAAKGAANALSPTAKIQTIAALAGLVLRLFRSREQLPPLRRLPQGAGKRPDTVRKSSGKAAGTATAKGGLDHG